MTRYAFFRYIVTTKEWEPIPLGDTTDSVAVKLCYDPVQQQEITAAMHERLTKATAAEKAEFTNKLRNYLEEVKAQVSQGIPGVDPGTHQAYTRVRDRVRTFMEQYGLAF